MGYFQVRYEDKAGIMKTVNYRDIDFITMKKRTKMDVRNLFKKNHAGEYETILQVIHLD